MGKRGREPGSGQLDAETITKLREEIMSAVDDKGHLPKGVSKALAEKYELHEGSIGFHKRQAQKGKIPGRGRGIPGGVTSNGAMPQQTLDMRRPAAREEIDFAAINADIDAGMTAEQIREKHNISDSLLYRLKKEKQEEEPVTPLSPDRCKRVIEIIAKLAEIHPDKFTRLDFLGQISKKYGNILAEII